MDELAEAVELLAALLGNQKDERENRRRDRRQHGKYTQTAGQAKVVRHKNSLLFL